MLAVDTTPLPRTPRARPFLLLAAVTAVLVAGGLVVAVRRTVGAIPRVDGVAAALSGRSDAVENYLLVGSDSRTLGDPNTGASAEEAAVSGTRSDTIMVLRRDRATGDATLLSIPRDLYVQIPGRDGRHRINAAYNDGPAALVATVTQTLGIPIHHYIEIDFTGFTTLVDALGGVEICVEHPAKDKNTGLDLPTPGCHLLGGKQALAFARSRYYEELIDGSWVIDPTSDLGRATRQRRFVSATMSAIIDRVNSNPLDMGEVIAALARSVRMDPDLDPVKAAGSLRAAVSGGIGSVALPVRPVVVDGNDVLELQQEALPILAWFAGSGTPPDGA